MLGAMARVGNHHYYGWGYNRRGGTVEEATQLLDTPDSRDMVNEVQDIVDDIVQGVHYFLSCMNLEMGGGGG